MQRYKNFLNRARIICKKMYAHAIGCYTRFEQPMTNDR